MPRSLKRSFGIAAFGAPLLMMVALSSCGDDDDAAPGTEVVVQPSSYITTPTTVAGATTTPGAVATGEPGDTSPTEQTYEVQPGDYLSGIAADFDVDMDEIVTYNNWADGIEHQLNPGDPVRIPPGAKIPSASDEEDSSDTTEEDSGSSDDESDSTDTTEEDSEDPELCPDGEPRGHYTIKEGDIPARVAASLDVTVDQLNEANANTSGYSAFIVGIRINIPCGGDADAAETTEA